MNNVKQVIWARYKSWLGKEDEYKKKVGQVMNEVEQVTWTRYRSWLGKED